MCGFAGVILSLPDSLHSDAISKLQESLLHRGPDDGGIYQSPDRRTVLTSRRLAIVDLSPAGHMPMPNEGGSVWIAYNGELYNFLQLRNDLQRRGHQFRSGTDTEVILHLYEEFGVGCVEQLRGMFAFAIWDEKKDQLFAARDRLGIKPLYYAANDLGVSFSSEIHALVAGGVVSPEPNWEALIAYLQLGSIPAPHTAIDGVLSLPPGSWLTIRNGKPVVQRYWELAFGGGETDKGRAVWRTRELLQEAVELHLVSDVPLGIFLSGGVDSSTIASLARACSPGKVRTISVAFPEIEYSEAPAARAMAQRIGTEHIELEVTADHVVDSIDRFIAAMDQPTIDGMNTFFISEATRASGTKVALSGLGGDELFGGYPSFRAVPLLAGTLRSVRMLPGNQVLAATMRLLGSDSRIQRASESLTSPVDPWSAAYIATRAIFPEAALSQYLRGTAYKAVSRLNTRMRLGEYINSWDSAVTPFDRVSAFELRGFMANQLLRDVDVFSMAHSIELRVPFLDHCLVEYVASLPATFKQGGKKRLLHMAMQDMLPMEVFSRPKKGFSFPWKPWLRGRLGDEVIARMRAAYPLIEDVIQVDRVEELWQGFRSDRVPWFQAWSLAILVLWTAKLRSSAPSSGLKVRPTELRGTTYVQP